jgi:hypothetical protein
MRPKVISILLVASTLIVGCDAVDTMKDGFNHSQAVSKRLESSLGLESQVGFSWTNGSLDSVTVAFSGVPTSPGLTEISTLTKEAVLAEFKQSPKTIVFSFSITK